MRRSRAPLTAWPAFADLMTVLAVVSLAIAAVVLGRSPGDEGDSRQQIAELRRQLDNANATIAEQRSSAARAEARARSSVFASPRVVRVGCSDGRRDGDPQ